MSRHEEIVKAVAAHAFWKVRLAGAVVARKIDVRSAEAKRDDACDFGKWLHAPATTAECRNDAHHRRAVELHAKFHQSVGACVAEMERGHFDVAKKVLEADVAKASLALTREMMAWNKEPA
jgi:hypothetical protein